MREYYFTNELEDLKKQLKKEEEKKILLNCLKWVYKKNGDPFVKITNNIAFEGYEVDVVEVQRYCSVEYRFYGKRDRERCEFSIYIDRDVNTLDTFKKYMEEYRDNSDLRIKKAEDRLKELLEIKKYILNLEKNIKKRFPNGTYGYISEFIDRCI